MANIKEVENFWNQHPCGLLSHNHQNEIATFEKIERDRYIMLNKISSYVDFAAFKGKRVLEVGCGIGTDALQFARSGAFYTGVDLTETGIRISQRRFKLFNQKGDFIQINAEELPFPDNYFDHVYSFGVIHHSPYPEKIVSEIHRVLKPGGTATIMLYNRNSFYYLIEVKIIRRLFFKICAKKRLLHFIFKLFNQQLCQRFESFRVKLEIMKRTYPHPNTEQWVSMNTDDVFCPIARVYSKKEAKILFYEFINFKTRVWFIDKDNWFIWIILGKIIPSKLANFLECSSGWLRMIDVIK